MEHDRLTTLSETPPDLPEARPDPGGLIRRAGWRRMRRIAAASVAASFTVIGLAVPLALLAGVGARAPGPGPAASGSVPISSQPALTTTGGSTQPGAAIPDVGVFRCTGGGVETDTPEFAVQSDGVHLQVGNPGESSTLILWAIEPPLSRLPINLLGSDGIQFVTPFLEPGTYEAACNPSSEPDGPPSFAKGESVTVHIVDPAGIWSVIGLPCSDTTERVILVGAGVDDRSQVPALIRRGVNGVEESDVIVPAGYPQSDEDIAYVVQRDGRNVAVVRALGRATPFAQGLDVTSCDGLGIGDGQGGR
jgi:hypothetical protein